MPHLSMVLDAISTRTWLPRKRAPNLSSLATEYEQDPILSGPRACVNSQGVVQDQAEDEVESNLEKGAWPHKESL